MRTRNSDKEKLVEQKTIEMLVEEGFQGFSMNRLAKACDISVATLYIYYKDKDDMIKKIGASVGKTFMSETLKGFSPEMSFADGLRKQWENRARYAIKYPKEVACYEIIRHSQHGEYILNESLKEFKQTMMDFVQNAVKTKTLIPLAVETYWSVAFGPLYTLIQFHKEGKAMGGKPFKLSKKTMEEPLKLVIKALTPSKN
ncbi:MAG: TetR/AcrR family transcriptional regulator [Bacteroidetes bacterium]|nr:MAG: TetR/AcrR family transcriptional regulator [Bacteroidota bacterium]